MLTWGRKGAPPVVLLHGFMQRVSSWQQIAERLANAHYVIAPCLDAHTPEVSLESLAREAHDKVCAVLAEVADGAGDHAATTRTSSESADAADTTSVCPRHALVGYSMGGRVALSYARLFGDQLDALVLESAGVGPADNAQRAKMEQRDMAWAQKMEASSIKQIERWWSNLALFATQKALPAEVRARVRDERLTGNPQHLAWLVRGSGQHTMPAADTTRALLKELHARTLYVYGTRDGRYTETAHSLRGVVDECVGIDCGHNVHLECPDTYTECLRAFLEGARA